MSALEARDELPAGGKCLVIAGRVAHLDEADRATLAGLEHGPGQERREVVDRWRRIDPTGVGDVPGGDLACVRRCADLEGEDVEALVRGDVLCRADVEDHLWR